MKINHGANLFELSKSLNCSIDEFKDFSSNINPFGVSQKSIQKLSQNLDKASIYPDPKYKNLKKNISTYCKCNSENLLLGSGASSFISAFIKILSPKKSLIITPAYSEYEKELKKINSEIFKYSLSSKNDFKIDVNEVIDYINKNYIDVIIICNPNNPTGSILLRKEIKEVLDRTKSSIIIDETYIEFTDTNKYSCINLCDTDDRIFVIRSTSKFFACPGIRLGYSVTSNIGVKDYFEKYCNILWDINIFADIMGQEMFLDEDYQRQTFEQISLQREFIHKELSDISCFKPYKTYGNFILVEIKNSNIKSFELYNYLLKRKMIIRDCSSFEDLGENYFRICILKKEDNINLINAIKDFVKVKNL